MSDAIPPNPNALPPNRGSLWIGALIALGCTLGAFVAVGMLTVFVGPVVLVLLGIGVVQAAWIIPLWLRYRRIGQTETAKGLLIMASVIFLLNAGCYGFVASLNFH